MLFNSFRLLVAGSVAATISLHAQTALLEPEEDLLSILDDATATVTKSKLNVDYTPSVVSVLSHQQLRSLGIKTLFEALSILPGIETSINHFGIKKVVFRGFDNPNNFTFDKAKLIVDGVAIETGMFGTTTYYLDLPTDLIERIEVLRGPGSALYGTGAFNGVVNVITRQNNGAGSGIFFGAGSYDYKIGGLRQQYVLNDDTTLHADAYYQRNEKMIPLGDDFIVNGSRDKTTFETIPFDREPQSNEAFEDYSVGATFKHGAWMLQARVKDIANGNYAGWDEYLELSADHETRQRYVFTQLQYQHEIARETTWTAQLGYSSYHLDLDAQNYYNYTNLRLVYYFTLEEKEENYNFDTFVTTSALDGHTLSAGIYLQSLREISSTINDDISPYGERSMIKEDLERNVGSVYLRDTIEINNNLSTLLALRLDHYEKEGKTYPSAQAGLVYTANDHWNFKFNYGHAFRAPSWVEQYTEVYGPGDGTRDGNPDLKAETTDTFEAIVIYRTGEREHIQGNIYYSFMDDVIDIEEIQGLGYDNRPKRTSYGLEMAYTLKPYKQDLLHLNFTYNKTTYLTPEQQIEQTMPGVAQVMAKGHYTHYFTPAFSLSALAKYIGKRPFNEDRTNPEKRVDLPAYTTVDMTMNYASGHHWDIRASVKNLLDEDVRYTSFYTRHKDGLPREGVNYLVEFEYTF